MKKLLSLLLITTACSTNDQEDIPFRVVEPSQTEEAKPTNNTSNQVVSIETSGTDLCFYPEGSFELTYLPISSTCNDFGFISNEPTLQIINTQEPTVLPKDCLGGIEKPIVNTTKDRDTCEIFTHISCKMEEGTLKFSTNLEMVTDTQVSGTYTISDTLCTYTWEITGKQINQVLAE